MSWQTADTEVVSQGAPSSPQQLEVKHCVSSTASKDSWHPWLKSREDDLDSWPPDLYNNKSVMFELLSLW